MILDDSFLRVDVSTQEVSWFGDPKQEVFEVGAVVSFEISSQHRKFKEVFDLLRSMPPKPSVADAIKVLTLLL